ncbi:MAG: hypothetical protein AAFP85_12875 [Pseudomonadota bacterium]
MKKQRKRQQTKKKSHQRAALTPARKTDRRAMLRNSLFLAGVVGVGGLLTANTVMATMAEHDLTRVGQGVPTIVQVHDPQCTSCQELQRETRAALKAFDEADLQYAVANITSAAGADFANMYGAPHVTLLLFDGAGELRGTLNGVRARNELQTAFERLVALDR